MRAKPPTTEATRPVPPEEKAKREKWRSAVIPLLKSRGMGDVAAKLEAGKLPLHLPADAAKLLADVADNHGLQLPPHVRAAATSTGKPKMNLSPALKPEGFDEGLDLFAEWEEGKHPRADDGKFGAGKGGSAPKGEGGRSAPVAGHRETDSLPPILNKIDNHGLKAVPLTKAARLAVQVGYGHVKNAVSPAVAALLSRIEFSGMETTPGGKVTPDAAGIALPGGEKGYDAWVGVSDRRLNDKAQKGLFVDADPAGKVRHEIGHAIERLLPYEKAAEIRELLHLKGKDWSPSLYGEENNKERFAEFFSLITRPGFDPKSVPPPVRKAAVLLLSGGGKHSEDFVEWEESKHKRGQPGNAGQFGPGGGGGSAPASFDRPPESAPGGSAPEGFDQPLESAPQATGAGWKPPSAASPPLPSTTPHGPAGKPSWPSRQSLASSPAKSSKRIGDDKHANVAVLLTLADGSRGVFKGVSGEAHMLRFGVDAGTYFQREIAASDVADILGFGDLVPPTVFRDEGDEPGSMQAFVEGAEPAFVKDGAGWKIDYDGDEDAGRAAAFDYLTGHLDRHAGNWLLKDGKLALIDNGLAFPHRYDEADFFNMQFLKRALDAKLPVPDVLGWAGKWPEVEKALIENGLEDEAVALTKQRFDALASGKYKLLKDLPDPLDPAGKRKLGAMVLARERSYGYLREPEPPRADEGGATGPEGNP